MLAFCAQALGRTTWAPFDGPAAGRPEPPVAPSIAVPSGVPQLSVARPYTVFIGQAALDSLSPGAKVPAALAADWNHVWRVDATIGASGLLLGNSSQLLIQLEGIAASVIYASICTVIIGFLINKVMGFKVSESEENIGLDKTQHGEVAYNT